jgi:hypothetical protein
MFNYIFPMASEVYMALCTKTFFWTNRITHYKQQSSHYFAVEYVLSTDIQQRELRTVIHKIDCLIAVTYYNKYLPLNVGYFRFK